jgi:hypothetical protein
VTVIPRGRRAAIVAPAAIIAASAAGGSSKGTALLLRGVRILGEGAIAQQSRGPVAAAAD